MAKLMAKTKVLTSSSGRRYVDIDAVIRRRLAELKKNGNGNGHHRSEKAEPAKKAIARASGKDSNP